MADPQPSELRGRVIPAAAHPDVCIVMAAFNEAAVVGTVIADLKSTFQRVVCVDDGSFDGTADIAAAHGAHVVRHSRNLGQGAALQTGIEFALRRWPEAAYLVTFDADGQHRVEDAVRMLETARCTGCQVVLGSRFLRPGTVIPPGRSALLKAGTWYTRITTQLRITDAHCGLRVLDRRFAESLNLRQPGMAHASEFLQHMSHVACHYTEVPVEVRYTEYSRRKGQHAINAFNILIDLALARLRPAR